MDHRFDKLARRVAKDLWDAVCTTIDRMNKRVEDGESYKKILALLTDAENFARDALRVVAKSLFVFPLPVRKTAAPSDAPAPKSTAPRAPIFRLGFDPIEYETEPSPSVQPSQRAGPSTKGEDQEEKMFASRIAALSDVLENPGRHAARYARAVHRREDDVYASFTLKCEDDILLDHIDRFVDDPAYYGTDAFRLTHAMFFDSG